MANPGAVRRSRTVVLLTAWLAFSAAAAMICADAGVSQAQSPGKRRNKRKPAKKAKRKAAKRR